MTREFGHALSVHSWGAGRMLVKDPAGAPTAAQWFSGTLFDFGLMDSHETRQIKSVPFLGPSARCPFTVSFFGEGSPTKIDYRKKGTLILTSLLEHLVS